MHFHDRPQVLKEATAAPGLGVLDSLVATPEGLDFFGWVLHPQQPVEIIRILLDGREVSRRPPLSRPDVKRVFPGLAHSDRSGYSVSLREAPHNGRIDILGESRAGVPHVYWSSFFRSDLDTILPSPPEALSNRVAGYSGQPFKLRGLKIFTDFHDQIRRYEILNGSSRILDWGSGCGSVSAHFAQLGAAEVVGADVDHAAMEWAGSSLPDITFDAIQPDPPLPYPDDRFDLITASSVFTHLSRQRQTLWLRELGRILAPGGWILASTHGERSRTQMTRSVEDEPWPVRREKWRWRLEYRLKGISDTSLDSTFQDIVPEGYYRTVLQSEAYTRRVWGRDFQIVDYIPGGLFGLQDLVVMRAR